MYDLVFYSIIGLILLWIYKRLISGDDIFVSQGIPYEKPLPIVGNIWPVLTKKEGLIQFLARYYQTFKNDKVVGFYGLMGEPTLIIRDPGMLKQIMIRDFDYFVNREANHGIETDKLLSSSVLLLRDHKWREMRTMLSPIYTSSKMKYMYELLTECMDEFIDVYEQKAKANGGSTEIETHDVFARCTADGIATTALGFKGDCVKNEKSKIYEIADNMETDFTNPTTITLTFLLPFMFKLFRLQTFRKSIHEFFLTNVLSEIQRRRDGKISRPDVIQLLVHAKEGQLKMESGDADELSYNDAKLKKMTSWTDEDLVGQALVFFLGGFETTATLMQVLSYELALNLEVQQTLIDEVDEVLQELGDKTISYDQLIKMKFLDMVVSEALRKRPSFPATLRNCSKDYLLKDEENGKSYKIKTGTTVFIPFEEMHLDPKYFPEPNNFDPYRFSDENKSKIQSGTYMPFGIGPRICIGSRYAILEAKLLLFYIMAKFRIEKCDKTPSKLTRTQGNSGYVEKIYVVLKHRK